jgi:CDP-glucose 4,6-dehydratase
MRAFVTGIQGFCGAFLAKKLLERGYEVIGIAQDIRPKTTLNLLRIQKDITLINGDVRNEGLLRRVIAEYKVDRVFHLAAQAIVSVALKDPLTTFDVNCMGTISLLNACRGMDFIESILVTSTDKVYGEGLNKNENDRLDARGVYETSKTCMDYAALSFAHIYGLPIVVPRSCNIYGENDFSSRIVPNTIRALKDDKQPIIFANDKSIREYIYIDDLVEAYTLLSDRIKDSRGSAWNIGTGDVRGQEEIVKKIIEVSGKDIEPKYIEKPKSLMEIEMQTVNSEKIRKTLGWKNKYSLDVGLKRTWNNWKI